MSNIYSYSPLWGSWIVGEAIRLNRFSKTHIARAMVDGQTVYSHIKHIVIPLDNKNDISVEGITTRKVMLDTLLEDVKISDLLCDFPNIHTYDAVKVVHNSNNAIYDIFLRLPPLKDLTEILCERSLTEIDVIKMAINICSALEIAEGKGIIHRHLSPDAIFINENDEFIVGDFCCGERLATFYDNSVKLKAMEYASPEEYQSGIITNSSNLYSLGMILYYLFNNCKLPFMPDNCEELKAREYNKFVYKRIFSDTLPKPENANDKITKIIFKCCEINPNDRWLCASDLKNALIDYYDGLVEDNDFKDRQANLTRITTSNLPALNDDFDSPLFDNSMDTSKGKTIIETNSNNSTVNTISISKNKDRFKIIKTTKNVTETINNLSDNIDNNIKNIKTYKPNRTIKPNVKMKTIIDSNGVVKVAIIANYNITKKNNFIIHNPKNNNSLKNTNYETNNTIDMNKEEYLDLENYVQEKSKTEEFEKLTDSKISKINSEQSNLHKNSERNTSLDNKNITYPKKSKSKKIFSIAIISVVIILIIMFTLFLLFPDAINNNKNNHNDTNSNIQTISETSTLNHIENNSSTMVSCATIPYLIGQTPENAKKLIAENNNSDVNINIEIKYSYSSVYEKGLIISQSIPENTKFDYDATIQIEVSQGLSDDMVFAKAHQQKIEVVSEKGNISNAKLTLYQYDNNLWKDIFTCNAAIGKNGVSEESNKNEYTSPKGTFNILFGFGNEKPTTALDFKTISKNTVLVTDKNSEYYNTLQNKYSVINYSYQDVYNDFSSNYLNYCIFFDYNGDGETKDLVSKNKDSGIMICGFNSTTLTATNGCIDIMATDMLKLLSYLDSSKKPVIIIS